MKKKFINEKNKKLSESKNIVKGSSKGQINISDIQTIDYNSDEEIENKQNKRSKNYNKLYNDDDCSSISSKDEIMTNIIPDEENVLTSLSHSPRKMSGKMNKFNKELKLFAAINFDRSRFKRAYLCLNK